MRTTIWEYLIPSAEEKEALWNNCVFVFDTNVLLNLYRYTSNTRDILLTAFDDLKERVWLPHQVAYEFAKNRCDVIYETVEKYKTIEKVEQEFISRLMTELRLKSADKSIIELKNAIDAWVADQKKRNLLVTQASDDNILNTVLLIFDKKVGSPFSAEEAKTIAVEGKERYEKQIPPGFCDEKKEKDGKENNIYGDLIVWKQILTYAAANHVDIIYVTHDQKKDWWSVAKGRTVGPRIELRKEFTEKTQQSFYMYSMESFLEQYSKHKGQQADQSVIEEVTQIDSRKRKIGKKKPTTLFEYSLVLERNIVNLRECIVRRQRAISDIETKYHGKKMPPEVITQLRNTEVKMEQLQHQLLIKQQEYDSCIHQISLNSSTY